MSEKERIERNVDVAMNRVAHNLFVGLLGAAVILGLIIWAGAWWLNGIMRKDLGMLPGETHEQFMQRSHDEAVEHWKENFSKPPAPQQD